MDPSNVDPFAKYFKHCSIFDKHNPSLLSAELIDKTTGHEYQISGQSLSKLSKKIMEKFKDSVIKLE